MSVKSRTEAGNDGLTDRDRLVQEYQDRSRRLDGDDRYTPFNLSNLFIIQQRQRELTRLLKKYDIPPLKNRSTLELGSGTGGVLAEFLSYGASPNNLHGTDLIFDRIKQANDHLKHLPLTCADGCNLPYPSTHFDIVLQFTVFSSILDVEIQQRLAVEMLRVLRQEGIILWYDFWLNPTNQHAMGLSKKRIKELFPRCQFDFHRITLAPPLARRLVPISWTLSLIFEKMRIFNTHFLVAISPMDNLKA